MFFHIPLKKFQFLMTHISCRLKFGRKKRKEKEVILFPMKIQPHLNTFLRFGFIFFNFILKTGTKSQ